MEGSQGQSTGMKRPRAESTAEQVDSPKTAGLEQVFACLQSKNDTQRFVGLTLLMKLLEGIKEDSGLVNRCWEAIPSNFLTGLLRAKALANPGGACSADEAQAKFQLGLDILHTFVSLLNGDSLMPVRMDEKTQDVWKRRLDAVLEEVSKSAETTKAEILQVLTTIAFTSMGGRLLYQLLAGRGWAPLIKETSTDPLAIRILFMIFETVDELHPQVGDTNAKDVADQLDIVLCQILKQIDLTAPPAKDLIDGLYGLFQSIRYRYSFDDAASSGSDDRPRWMEPLAKLIGTAVTDRRSISSGMQESVVRLARLLVERIPQFKLVLFDPSMNPTSGGRTPLSFIFTTTLLIDIRSTIPSISEIQDKPGYLQTSTRLANSYDLVFLYLDFLLEAEDAEEANNQATTPRLPYDLLLQLQESITQTMRLTVESLRDRYDAAAPDETKLLRMAADTLVVSQIGALGFWLHDEDSASADDLLEVLLRLCLCETPYRQLYARTVEVMIRERPDLQRRAQALVEGDGGLGKVGRGGGDFFRVEVGEDLLGGLGGASEDDEEDEEEMWGGVAGLDRDWMPGDEGSPAGAREPRVTRRSRPEFGDPEDYGGYGL